MVDGFLVTLVIFISIVLVIGSVGIVGGVYQRPQAAEKANQICQANGYDFYEKFERIGFLSNEPVAIECKYVQNYQEMDIKLRQVFGEELMGVGE